MYILTIEHKKALPPPVAPAVLGGAKERKKERQVIKGEKKHYHFKFKCVNEACKAQKAEKKKKGGGRLFSLW